MCHADEANLRLQHLYGLLEKCSPDDNQEYVLQSCDFLIAVLMDIQSGALKTSDAVMQKLLEDAKSFCDFLEENLLNIPTVKTIQ